MAEACGPVLAMIELPGPWGGRVVNVFERDRGQPFGMRGVLGVMSPPFSLSRLASSTAPRRIAHEQRHGRRRV